MVDVLLGTTDRKCASVPADWLLTGCKPATPEWDETFQDCSRVISRSCLGYFLQGDPLRCWFLQPTYLLPCRSHQGEQVDDSSPLYLDCLTVNAVQ